MTKAMGTLLASMARRQGGYYGGLKYWLGDTPHAPDGQHAYAVARMGGYDIGPASGGLIAIPREEAIATLAFLLVGSLVRPVAKRHPAKTIALVVAALDELGPSMEFYSNGRWSEYPTTSSFSSHALSHSTFDAGVIGVSPTCGFLLWVEEED